VQKLSNVAMFGSDFIAAELKTNNKKHRPKGGVFYL